MSKFSLLLFVSVLNCAVLLLVHTIVDMPYMDETFHVNQFLEIEKWIFFKNMSSEKLVWDESITTFPGLYFVSLPLSFISTNLFLLRGINAILLPTIMFFTIMRITKSDNFLSLSAIFFPLNFFFSFLYYTDTVATGSVLLLVLLKAEKRFAVMGVLGAVAVLMRQTNIVWLFGLCLSELLPRIHTSSNFASLCVSVIRDFYTCIAVGLGFVVFLVWNNYSVVLGHQEFHSFSLHLAQINYFVLTCVACSGPKEWCSIIVKSVKNTRRDSFFIFFALSVLASELGTIVHPFILADNRHYSFYVYRYFLSKRWIRSLAIPALVSLSILHSKIFTTGTINIMSKPVFWLCTFICLVPTPLLEFRYFTVPYLLLLLSRPWDSQELLFSNLFFSMLVNAAVMYAFLYRPFRSPEGSLSRFMY